MVTSHKFEKGNIVKKNKEEGPEMTVLSSTVNYFKANQIDVICEYFDEKSKTSKILEFNQHDLMLIRCALNP